MDLQELENVASVCSLCELYKGRNKPVFAKGNPLSKIVIVGMCPGPEENRVGTPFIGDAGQILDEILMVAFNEYKDAYITNLVKCFVRPGIKLDQYWCTTCLPYLIVQLGLIKPKVIIGLGKDVCNYLLNNKKSMGAMRGKIYNYLGDIKLISTYHPAFLARGNYKKFFNVVVNDFKLALNYL